MPGSASMSRAKRISLSVILATELLLGASSHVLAQGAMVFEGARLITGEPSAPIENSAVVVESGRITAVGRRGDVTAPAGATRIDLTGKTMIPALIDAHSHIG